MITDSYFLVCFRIYSYVTLALWIWYKIINIILNLILQEVNEFKLSLQHKEQQLRDMSKQLQQANNDRIQLTQQLGELHSSLTICRKQIGIAHATVSAESLKPSLTYGLTESNWWGWLQQASSLSAYACLVFSCYKIKTWELWYS